MNRRQFLQTLSAATATGLLGAAKPAAQPNIVFIYADDLGYGDVSCYGAKSVHTPNIDSLAAEGLRFTDAHATSATCTPSRYSVMTGQYAWRKPGTGVLPGDASLIIDTDRLTLPELLKRSGYRTGIVGKWHLGLGRGEINWNSDITPGPNELGFDYSFIIPATPDRVPCVFVENHRVVNLDAKDPIHISYKQPFPNEKTGRANPELLKMKPSHGHDMAIVDGVSRIGYMEGGKSALWVDEDIADTLSAKAVRFIEQSAKESSGQPFFLYYPAHDIHVPRLPNKRFQGKTSMGPRGDAIAELDWCVGRILNTLKKNGLTQNTLIVFSSDNGPVVDDGYQDQSVEKLGSHKPSGIYRGGKYSNFAGGTRVPFLVKWPDHVKPATTSDALVDQIDLFASFATLTHQSLAHNDAPDSVDILPALLGRSSTGRQSLVEEADVLALVQGEWKLIEGSNKPAYNENTRTELGNALQPQLYHRISDPEEHHDVAALHPDIVKRMIATLNQIRSEGRSRR
ncbi:sulfatase-like hydrolase/transferase [Edaphobacter sp. 12200R-103]|uniref:sulfatase-like hydrolase/transferase n=1 Tax=Edaphobacter sp. 12200R-103 TaxID=2703788 RepID=UPI00138C42EA|nr:sulfatase-like hydrolase/transferase [Edaphobacter sp. 12200R-103]QHS51857.1 arylsulfatase [Edaphobacter sp. 12200R-103]